MNGLRLKILGIAIIIGDLLLALWWGSTTDGQALFAALVAVVGVLTACRGQYIDEREVEAFLELDGRDD